MKYYKVIYKKRVIDVLDKIVYIKYQKKHNTLMLCDEDNAEGILSSTGDTAYHLLSLRPFPIDDFLTVSLEQISEHEYNQLKMNHCMSAEEIIDQYTASLFEQGVL